ncbi:glycosyltransferase family 2 protein [Streptococcus pneumoniae]|uniref:Putative glycosyl transferase n=1 Tax=Streptococcus pneumoniae TaxID=1313 RepID=Q4JYQ1_STREE|nr:glycosyltransferase family 2 protein [Streptococcus pneumoniae]MDS3370807.1 glycosyltransferase family 2 protein [Streptococcus pneumoniae]MDT6070804.1 glycosyltransferase family 2 protein [Streptococcus pneumoniae]MDT6204673.1 glycosyltransferase family 2 protein [Streptococcus pneumoniae]CAI34585.1 putative glycosyl transferase [Streptococcus pneumoniae]CJD98663.1 glycosyl transferase family protein [Streptococcus pneumoniae]
MRISVAMTTYNGADYLLEQLESLRTQSLMADEVIIVDDCSTDNTVELLDMYIQKYHLDNWVLIRNSSNIGWRKNFRKALQETTGDIVFLCDQDDIWNKDKISLMVKEFHKSPSIELLASNYEILDFGRNDKIKIRDVELDNGAVVPFSLKNKSISVMRPGCTFAVKRELIVLLEKYDIDRFGHDNILWNLAMIRGTLYLYLKRLIHFRRHETSASAPNQSLNRDRRVVEVDTSHQITVFLLDAARREHLDIKIISQLENMEMVLERRRDILKYGTLMQIVHFQLKYHTYYPTFRNLLSDILVFLKK